MFRLTALGGTFDIIHVGHVGLIEKAVSKKDYASLPKLMTDKWLEDVSLFGSHSEVREGIEKWYETGLKTPILVPSSVDGGQFKAFNELFELFTELKSRPPTTFQSEAELIGKLTQLSFRY